MIHRAVLFLMTLLALESCQSRTSETTQPPDDSLSTTATEPLTQSERIGEASESSDYISFIAEAKNIRMYLKHEGEVIRRFEKLKAIEPNLVFAMNGGMFMENHLPVGLYVEKGTQVRGINKHNNPKVNFGIQPQGIFLIRDSVAQVIPIEEYNPAGVTYATQSAPMLIVNSAINPNLPKGNSSNIRNGVGMLPDGRVLLAMSRRFVTFQEFAHYFLDQGCPTALYLDGGVSEVWLPGRSAGGEFGPLIGVVGSGD